MHSQSAVNTVKITLPVVGRFIERGRLYRKLDEQCKRPMMWITGPGGSGKTTLIASYIQHHALPAIWFQADEGDGDAATFFHYLALAAQLANPEARHPFPILTADYQSGLPAFSRRFFEQVFACLPDTGMLVIDNYQDIIHDSSVHAMIQVGMEVMPAHVTVVFLSRHELPEGYSRMQANQQIGRIDWKDLSLRSDEAQAIVAQRGKHGQQLSQDVCSRIDGWVAGLVLFLEWVQQEGQTFAIFDDYSPESIFDYFASEIMRRTDTQTRDILLKSSLLPTMNARLVTQLTGNSESNSILAGLARQNYFVTRYPGREISYQYHPLFREFLLKLAAEEYSGDAFGRLRAHAGQLLEEDSQFEAAIETYETCRSSCGSDPRLISLWRDHD